MKLDKFWVWAIICLHSIFLVYGYRIGNFWASNPFSSRLFVGTDCKFALDYQTLYGPNGEDLVWQALRNDAQLESSREPLLASFMHASILSHSSLERSLAFHMSNLLSSPAMLSTQIQALFLEAFETSACFRASVRIDVQAVATRDPAVKTLTDVLLYFKGFHALQTHRVANLLWRDGRKTLALYLHSRANAVFQIDIHPGAELGKGILIDHGTGVVIGETAVVGDNVSMLHKVTLGGTGTRKVKRHPHIGNGVLLGAGATLLGPITVGDGTHIGAGSMVLDDIPSYSVAVGVPARIITRKVIPKQLSSSDAASSSSEGPVIPALTMETNSLYFDI